MAALTASSIYEESMGSNTLYIINFAAVATDTYTNLKLAPQVIGYWANTNSAGGAGSVDLVTSTGVFTISNALNSPTTLFVVAKQA